MVNDGKKCADAEVGFRSPVNQRGGPDIVEHQTAACKQWTNHVHLGFLGCRLVSVADIQAEHFVGSSPYGPPLKNIKPGYRGKDVALAGSNRAEENNTAFRVALTKLFPDSVTQVPYSRIPETVRHGTIKSFSDIPDPLPPFT